MCNWAITVSSFLFVQGQTTHRFKTGNISCNLFHGSSSHSDCRPKFYDFKSENGMSSTMSPIRESLAAASAAELSIVPTWPGTQTKTISFPSLIKSIYSSRIWTKTGYSYFRLNIAFSDESGSDSMKNDFLLEQ